MRTCCDGRYERRHDDTWVYAATGEPVPGAEDMTISNLFNLPVIGDRVIVPRSLAHNEPDLAWCLAYADTDGASFDRGVARGMGRDPNIPIDAMLVPVAEWDRRAVPIGMWAPELHPANATEA